MTREELNRILFMEKAYTEAIKAKNRGDYAIGAVIVFDDNIISKAGNEVITRGIVPYAHAEYLALDNLIRTKFDNANYYRNMSVYTTLAPCPMCFGRMLVAGIKEIIYAAPDLPSTQNYSESVPEIFKPGPMIIELGGDIGERCKNIFESNREEIDRRFFCGI